MSATDQRRSKVLRAIVADYIATQEPVGSKALVERHGLGVSSATIRNDMAVLEEQGYIVQQHASSGRIPTEKAYRVFVDSIHDVKPLSAPERRAILTFLENGVDLEDVLRRSVQLLAQLTRQAAVVQLPTLRGARVRHCEVVDLTPSRLLLVVISDTGRVDQRNVDLGQDLAPEQVVRIRELMNKALTGKSFSEASIAITEAAAHPGVAADIRNAVVRCATVLVETLVEAPSDRLILAGASNLTRMEGLPTVLDALEEQVVMLNLLNHARELGQVHVRIGQENADEQLRKAAIVATGYGNNAQAVGAMGVVGPTAMDYSGTISKVSAVAAYVSRVLGGQ